MSSFFLLFLVLSVYLGLLVLFLTDKDLLINIFLLILLIILLSNNNGTSFLNILILSKVVPQEIVDIS